MKLKSKISRLSLLMALSISFSSYAATTISIDKALKDCSAAGNTLPAGAKAVQSDLKKETSLIGMAYLNYIYQNDITNPHFCQSMLLMNSQVPANTNNPYVILFDSKNAQKTMSALQDVQLAFDYSIGRSSPADDKMWASINKLKALLK